MPAAGRAASSAVQPARSSRTGPEHTASSKRSEKAKSAQAMPPPRRESVQHAAAVQRPDGIKGRANSAPMYPKNHHDGPDDHMDDLLAGEPCDDDEISADPFFQRYNFPQSTEPCPEEASSSSVDSSSDTEGPLSPTHLLSRQPGPGVPGAHSGSESPAASEESGNSDLAPAMQDINIAVLGARGVGKSTFIRRALDLADTTATAFFSRKMAIDGTYYIVRFIEICFTDVHIGDRNNIKWPETIDDLAMPRVDGAVTVYDVTSEDSLKRVPEMLNVLSKSNLPFVLVACKCDQHPAHREVDPAVVEQKAKSFLGDVHTFQTSETTPEAHRGCLSIITRAVIASKRPQSQASQARRRANSSAVRSTAKDPWGRKHERASSEYSVSRYRPRSSEVKGHRYKSSETPGHTFLDLDESPGSDSYDSDAQASDAEQSIAEQPSNENGYTFDQLVDRLLAQPMSKNDSKFVSIFTALYRRFAAPCQLLDAILKRFEALNKDKNPPVIRIISQLRYLTVLQQWVSYYPGDFAYPTTRRTIRKFVASLAANREFSVAAKEIMHDLEVVTDDDDTDWACNDRQRNKDEHIPTFHNNVLDEDSEDDDFTRALGHMSMTSDRLSIARSNATGTSRNTQSTSDSSNGSSQTLLNQVEKNEKLAKLLVPNPIKPLSKIQWHQLISESDEHIAKELTRMDWIMFSSIRPRDLVRHVSMNAEEKKRCKSLENVNRMIDHFNHIAYLVTNYVLLRDKPKHRALMLEKWMKIARAVRQLNNYNALGAVLAGIKGTAVHRLVATRDLVPPATFRDFMKLEILMGTQKSHFAYRLAWENSSGERIPYIPLHRRDLVSASEGNSTFVGDKNKNAAVFTPHPGVSVFQGAAGSRDSREAPPGGVTGKERINWRKFEIMGEVIVGVQRAQGTPYQNWNKVEEVRNLILDVKIIKDDDELYDRSVQLEAAGAGERRRFNWFRER
ncbi:ras guanine nucleotide exchange factor domain-containing protein [Massariosphaeria phaeospora]|uniref:Ras guanine nucleotide exchange factor domain-containing protein n=1 Tax=Massariosphaeria phaeospora TaxID=100035 RepID=A0A7C8M0J4_9PLEO|nr:ras guanine nucleotide exchange factor domain-containing protein [Massariosphaeria phaeospora]